MKKALDGIRVVDLSHVLAGPTATMFLADLGAEVIHIEPETGDDSRQFGPYIGETDINKSCYFISLNRNKKSLVLNLKTKEGKAILKQLIKKSDVLVDNHRPGALKKLGFGWAEVHKMNPRLIYAAISGFGHDTLPQYSSRPAYDVAMQAYSGIMSITGPEGGAPCRVGTSIGDILSGYQAALSILTALFWRQKTNRGQFYDGSMVDGLFSVLENAAVRYANTGEIARPLGSAHPSIAPFQAFKAKDGVWIIVAIGNDKLWQKFCRLLKRTELIDDCRFTTNFSRAKNRKSLAVIIQKELALKTAAAWSKILEKAGIPYSPLHNIKDICEDEHIKHRGMLQEINQPLAGRMHIVNSPFRLSETPAQIYAPAPLLGEHSSEILARTLGYSPAKIERLEKTGVIKVYHSPKV
jgi:CoA:oxalate CoA-transferase